MPAGFESYIEGTVDVQLDNEKIYYHMVANGTIPSGSWVNPTLPQGTGHSYNYRVLSGVPPWTPHWVAANDPIVAFHTPVGYMARTPVSGSWASPDAAAAGVQWFLFDRRPPAASSNGFELYIPGVRRVFSSSVKPMRVLGVITDAYEPRWQPPSGLGSRKLAGAIMCVGASLSVYGDYEELGSIIRWTRWWNDNATMFHISYGTPARVGSYLTWRDNLNESPPFIDIVEDTGANQLLLLDVTGY